MAGILLLDAASYIHMLWVCSRYSPDNHCGISWNGGVNLGQRMSQSKQNGNPFTKRGVADSTLILIHYTFVTTNVDKQGVSTPPGHRHTTGPLITLSLSVIKDTLVR